jgi:hypothetical protein
MLVLDYKQGFQEQLEDEEYAEEDDKNDPAPL